MSKELEGKTISDVEVRQEKCLNMGVDDLKSLMADKKIGPVTTKGKWIFIKLEPDAYFMLSLGMGGNVLFHKHGEDLPEKYQLAMTFKDGSRISIAFWWFGYAHAATANKLAEHKMTAKLGISPLDDAFTYERLNGILKGKKGNVKSVLMDQACIAGIGNVYIQDILFNAKVHPDRKVPSLSYTEKKALHKAIKENLSKAISQGGIAFEKDLYGNPGRITEFPGRV